MLPFLVSPLVLPLIHSQNRSIAMIVVYGLQDHLSCIENAILRSAQIRVSMHHVC